MVLVWSGLLRTRSPWLMSLVQVAPLLALPAKGLLSLAACGVHEPPTPLVGEHPDVLRREVEKRRRHRGETGHLILAGRGHVGPVRNLQESRKVPPYRPRAGRGRARRDVRCRRRTAVTTLREQIDRSQRGAA